MLGKTAYRERRSQAQPTEWRRKFVRLRGGNAADLGHGKLDVVVTFMAPVPSFDRVARI